jgi:hypothetical protein
LTDTSDLFKILGKFQIPLRLHDGDIITAVTRSGYLKQKIRDMGSRDTKLALTSLYLLARTPTMGRRVISSNEFVQLCSEFGLDFTSKDLWRLASLYYENEVYHPISNSIEYFEACWYDLSKHFRFPDSMHDDILFLLKQIPTPGRKLEVVVAAAVYNVVVSARLNFLQNEIADFFGISDVALRNATNLFKGIEVK